MMALFPLILVSLHTLCTKTSCKPVLPFDKLPKTLKEVWDPQAFLTVVGFTLVLRVLSFIPLGSKVTTSTGATGKLYFFINLSTFHNDSMDILRSHLIIYAIAILQHYLICDNYVPQ